MLRITGGEFRGRYVSSVPDSRTRPTSSILRKAVFDLVEVENVKFLELFCGSCVVSIEALSRGACCSSVVDISRKALDTCRRNLMNLNLLDRVRLYMANVLGFVKSSGESFDVIFMDPPYDTGLVEKTLKNMNEEILKPSGILIIEKSKREDVFVPDFLEVTFRRVYGDSELVIMRKRG